MPVAWGQVRGQVVFDSAWCAVTERAASGFSMVGTRSLLLTDYPAVYVHDTGGLGSPYVAALEPAGESGATVELTERSTRLVADLRLPQGRSLSVASTAPLPPSALAQLTSLGGRLLPDAATAAFVSPCAVSVTLMYEPDPAGAQPATAPAPAPAPLPERAAYVVVKDGRLELRSRGQVLVYWPVNRIAVTTTGPTSVEVRGGAVLEGRFLTGVALHLVTPQVVQAFLAVVGPVGPVPATVGTSAPVTVRGLAGGTEPTEVDCVIGESALELQRLGAATVLARFDLSDTRLRVAGSAEHFVVFTPDHGPVSVRSAAEAFGARLHEHPAVRAAAERTLAAGPYPAETADGQPVACAVTPDAVRVKGQGVDTRVAFPDIRTVEGESSVERARLRFVTEQSEVTLTGQLELVRAIHTEVVAGGNATADPARVPDLLRAAAGLEEDYFLYTVFGPFYELHAALLGDATADRLGEPATAPGSDQERARVAAVLTEGLAELQRHLDQVGFVLPAFVRHRDAALLAAATDAEPAWLKTQEAQLRAACAPVQRAAGETAALAGQVSRLLDLDPGSLPRPSYTGAAVSLGAAALLNPVFLVSGATQAYSQYSQREQRKAEAGAASARGWELVLQRWNTLVGTSVPALGYVLTENLFGIRWEAAHQLTLALRDCPVQRRAAALRGVARRLARLDVLRRYPMYAGIRLRRGEIADHLRFARDAIRTPRFVEF